VDDFYKELVDSYILCPKCRKKCEECPTILSRDIMGQGSCPVHGRFVFSIDRLKIVCKECARISGRCQLCGDKFGKTVMVLGTENL